MRSFYLYRDSSPPSSPSASPTDGHAGPWILRLKYRDMLWAFHSEGQDLLLDESVKTAGGKLTWATARTLGLALWVKPQDMLVRSFPLSPRTALLLRSVRSCALSLDRSARWRRSAAPSSRATQTTATRSRPCSSTSPCASRTSSARFGSRRPGTATSARCSSSSRTTLSSPDGARRPTRTPLSS